MSRNKILFWLLSITTLVSAETFKLDTDIPLGFTYDGKYIYVADVKSRILIQSDLKGKVHYQKKLALSGIRGMTFFQQMIYAVYKKRIYAINPINAVVEEKITTRVLTDPTTIAVDRRTKSLLIFNRTDKKIYFYSLENKRFSGSISVSPSLAQRKFRGGMFFRGYLWVALNKKDIVKINPQTGEAVLSIPTEKDVFSVCFISGKLYAASPGGIFHIPYVETETYVATTEKQYNLQGTLTWKLPWDPKILAKEKNVSVSVRLLPVNGHQRPFRVRIGNRPLPRKAFGERELVITDSIFRTKKKFPWQLKIRTYKTRFYLSHDSIQKYYQNPELPKEVLPYLDLDLLTKQKSGSADFALQNWEALSKEAHPWRMIAFASSMNLSLTDKLYFFRKLGLPARAIDLMVLPKDTAKTKKSVHFEKGLEVYIRPLGWFPITSLYSAKRPKEFPIDENMIQILILDSAKIRPLESSLFKANPIPEIFTWEVQNL